MLDFDLLFFDETATVAGKREWFHETDAFLYETLSSYCPFRVVRTKGLDRVLPWGFVTHFHAIVDDPGLLCFCCSFDEKPYYNASQSYETGGIYLCCCSQNIS